jgi:hypothetical protein
VIPSKLEGLDTPGIHKSSRWNVLDPLGSNDKIQ